MKKHISLLASGLILLAGVANAEKITDAIENKDDWKAIEDRGFWAPKSHGLSATAGAHFFQGNTEKIVGITKEFDATYEFGSLYKVTVDVGNPNVSPLGKPAVYFMVDVEGDGYNWKDVILGGGRSLIGKDPAPGEWETWTLTQTFTNGMTTVGGHAISNTDKITIVLFYNPPGQGWKARESTAFDNLTIVTP